MKILELGKYYYPYNGGIENYTRFCCMELSKDHQVECLVFNTENQSVTESIDGIKVTRASSFGNFASQELSVSIFWFLLKSKADVIHFHTPNPLVNLYLFFLRPKSKLVITHHTDIEKTKKFYSIALWLYRRLLKRATHIIVFTKRYATGSEELRGFEDKIRIIPHGVNREELIPDKSQLEEINQVNDSRKTFNILFIGRHVHYKGVDVLIKAVAQMDGVLLRIAGTGVETVNYHKLVSELNVHHKVVFLGNLYEDKKIAYATSDVVVLPCRTRIESFGIILVEAQLFKKPTIVSDVETGTLEVSLEGETGLVFRSEDVDSLKTCIERLKNDSILAQQLGENGYKRAMNNFVDEVTSQKMRNLFSSIELLKNK